MNELLHFKLLNTKYAKIMTVCMLYFISALFGFVLIVGPKSTMLHTILISIYFPLLVFGIYIMIGTNKKLIVANFFLGVCLFVLSLSIYGILVYNLFEIGIVLVLCALFIFSLLVSILGFKVISLKKLRAKNISSKANYGMVGYFIGSAVGSFVLSAISNIFGKDGEFIFINIMLVFLWLILLYGGVV